MNKREIPRKRIIIYIVLLILTILMMILLGRHKNTTHNPYELPSKNAQRDWKEIKKSGKLTLLTSYNGLDYKIEGDSVKGFVYKVSKELSKLTGLNVDIKIENNWPKSELALSRGEVDVIAIPTLITTDLDKAHFKALNPIEMSQFYLVKKKGQADDIDSIVIPQGIPAKLIVQNIADEWGKEIKIVEDSIYGPEQLSILVNDGKISNTIVASGQKERLIKLLPNIDCSTPLSVTLRKSWLVRNNSTALADSLNRWLPIAIKKI
ncbi:MAG: transporter substrate-binding domain-containing protein [Porphyromonadaceae bacterium]|nr:transporter substrate-binding domain-containing protein [Porphyromonadaceae bacterium]